MLFSSLCVDRTRGRFSTPLCRLRGGAKKFYRSVSLRLFGRAACSWLLDGNFPMIWCSSLKKKLIQQFGEFVILQKLPVLAQLHVDSHTAAESVSPWALPPFSPPSPQTTTVVDDDDSSRLFELTFFALSSSSSFPSVWFSSAASSSVFSAAARQ